MMYERCDRCRWWNYISIAALGASYDRGSYLRHAPQPTNEEQGKNLTNYCGTWFPETDSDDRCGEFAPIPLTVLLPRHAESYLSAGEERVC